MEDFITMPDICYLRRISLQSLQLYFLSLFILNTFFFNFFFFFLSSRFPFTDRLGTTWNFCDDWYTQTQQVYFLTYGSAVAIAMVNVGLKTVRLLFV